MRKGGKSVKRPGQSSPQASCSQHCQRNCPKTFSTEELSDNYQSYHSCETIEGQNKWLSKYCRKLQPRTIKDLKMSSISYTLSQGRNSIDVCQKFFIEVLGLPVTISSRIAKVVVHPRPGVGQDCGSQKSQPPPKRLKRKKSVKKALKKEEPVEEAVFVDLGRLIQ